MGASFEFGDESFEFLETLRTDLGASTRGDVLRHAMAVMRWATDKVRGGYHVVAISNDGEMQKELSNPLLDRAAKADHWERAATG